MYRFLLKYLVVAILLRGFVIPNQTTAQELTSKIQLVWQQDELPIPDAYYSYGTVQGVSDANGFISITFVKALPMVVSHIGFGSIQIEPASVEAAIQTQKLFINRTNRMLAPVTVIALHPTTANVANVELDYQNQMAHDAGNLSRMTPLIAGIRKSGSYGTDPVIRGFKYEQIAVVQDGLQTAGAACPNRMDPPSSQIVMNMMEQVEVLKGPFALRYGNALGGTINFVSPPIHYGVKPSLFGRLSTGYESNGGILRTEGMGGVTGKFHHIKLFGSYSKGDDYSDGNGNKVSSAFSRGSFGGLFALKVSQKQEFAFSVARNFARDSYFPSLPMDLRSDDTWMLNARHTWNYNDEVFKSLSTNAYASLVDHFMDNRLKVMNPRTMDAETDAKNRSYGFRTEALFAKNAYKLYAGLDFKIEEAEGTRVRYMLTGPMTGKVFNDNAWQHGRIQKAAFFMEYSLKAAKHLFTASARLEANHGELLDPASEFLKVYPDPSVVQLNPSLSTGMSWFLNHRLTVSAWLARAQRSAGISERYINYFPIGLDPYEILGNPALKPEVNNQADVELKFATANTKLSLNAFASYLQQFIASVIDTSLTPRIASSPGVRRMLNLDKALMAGTELNINQVITTYLKANFDMAFVYGENLDNKSPLPEIPPLDLRLSLIGSVLNAKLQPEVSVRYVIQQDRIAPEVGETVSPEFMLLDVGLTYHINKYLRANCGVQNVLDVAYYEHLSRVMKTTPPSPLYAPGRNFYVSLNFSVM